MDITKLIQAAEKVWEDDQLGTVAEIRQPVEEKEVDGKVYQLQVVMVLKDESGWKEYKGDE